MAYLFQPDYVKYTCSCGSLKPISKIYFCRHCLKIRCGYCVCQEVNNYIFYRLLLFNNINFIRMELFFLKLHSVKYLAI